MSHAPSTRQSLRRTPAVGVLVAVAILGGEALSSAAVAAPTSTESSRGELRRDVISAVNNIRAAQGCRPVRMARQLNTAGQRHATDMSRKDYFSHTSRDGRSWVSRIRATGWREPAGENIARGFDEAGPVMRAWMNSPSHRRNILDCSFRYIGVGYAANGGYWVQDFGY